MDNTSPVFGSGATSPRNRVLSGSAVLLSGLGFVTLLNFAYNIAVARYLGPVQFGHTTAVYTLLILISGVTLSLQILTAKVIAQQSTLEGRSHAYRKLHWRGWTAGFIVSFLLVLFRSNLTNYLHLNDETLILLLALAILFYVPLGARRGYIQGICSFPQLSLNLIVEAMVRLGGSLILIWSGTGVRGVIAANAAAVAVAYFVARPKLSPAESSSPDTPIAFREGLQAGVFFAGQVLISNCDIVVVKHLFPAESAGIYAAVAMVGRVVFAFSWAVVSSMFPIAAEVKVREQSEDTGVLRASLLIVATICVMFVVGLRIAPNHVWAHLFGPNFQSVGGDTFRYLLILYAISAGLYALSVVVIAYEMSRKIANTGWVQLLVSMAVIGGIYVYHASLAQVIWWQIIMMIVLFAFVAIPFLAEPIAGVWHRRPATLSGSIGLGPSVRENEVISEFLRNDFVSPQYARFHDDLSRVVNAPNLDDPKENELRRLLLDIRHGSLWRELPASTKWFAVEINESNLHRLRVFPRAQWRKLATGDFGISQVLNKIQEEHDRGKATGSFHEKIDDLQSKLEKDMVGGAILLIGSSESGPFTILDGNHRLVASTLRSPADLARFRFYCGISSKMDQCCWYHTNPWTLLRYGRNLLRHCADRPERKLNNALLELGITRNEKPVPEPVFPISER